MVHADGTSISPASGRSSPRIAANRLDLPEPLAPTIPTLWRSWTVRSASVSRRRAPRASVRCERRSTAVPRSGELVVVVDDERCVVGEAAIPVDRRRPRGRRDAARRDLVVDAPADVLLPCL